MNFDKLRAFQDRLTEWRIPGNDCAVYKDGETVYRHMSGYSNVERGAKIRGDELYFFWSATKLITTSLALRLFENGNFKMDDPLYEYIPEFRNMSVKIVTDGKVELLPAKNPILIRHLFNMSAGFDYNLFTSEIREVCRSTGFRSPTLDVARAIAQSPLQFEAGTRWKYSVCHDVLGAFIEVVSGKKLRDYAREALFEPLGMNDTTYNLPSPDKMSRMATQYCWRDDLGKYISTNNSCGHILGSEYDSGGAGIVASCEDYMKFASCIADGGTAKNGYRFLSRDTVDMWKTNTLSPVQIRDLEATFGHMRGCGYGYGVRTILSTDFADAPRECEEFGWSGAAGVIVMIDTSRRMALVYVQHMLTSHEAYILPRLRKILYESI